MSDPADLKPVQEAQAQGPDLIRCYRQSEPIHRLPKLTGIPILILSGEASFHAPLITAHRSISNQAGVEHTFVQLAKVGIRGGNGHFLQLEKNSLQIARLVANWLDSPRRQESSTRFIQLKLSSVCVKQSKTRKAFEPVILRGRAQKSLSN